MLVSIVIPLYNEEEALEGLKEDLETMRSGIEALGHRVEVVFVDDGSIDGTSWELAVLYGGRPDVRVVAHRINRGFGAAFRSGIEQSRGAVIVGFDGDSPYPPEDAALMVEAVQGPENADVCTVSPWAKGGGADGVTPLRRTLSRGVSLLYRIALKGRGRGLTCFTASYRAYKADALRSVEFESDGFLATAEILCRLIAERRRVMELPSRLRPRRSGVSKMKVGPTIRAHLRLLLRVLLGRVGSSWVAEKDSALVD